MEEAKDKKWAQDQNANIENERREWGGQGENRADEIRDWRIEGIEEDDWSLGNHRKRMDKYTIYLQTIEGGFE